MGVLLCSLCGNDLSGNWPDRAAWLLQGRGTRSGDGVIARTVAERLNDLLFIVQAVSIIVEAFTFKQRRFYALLLVTG